MTLYACPVCKFNVDVDEKLRTFPLESANAKHREARPECKGAMIRSEETEGSENKEESHVDHPRHYRSHPSSIDPITICRHCNFNIGNAIKYILRHEHKGNPVQDLNKSIWCLRDEIERLGGKVEERT